MVVRRVVLVVAGGLEDGRHVDRGGTQGLDVVQLVDDALQVAAKEVVVVDRIRAVAAAGLEGRVQPARMTLDAVVLVTALTHARVVGRIAVAKALGEQVVIDGALRPARHLEGRVVDGQAVTPHTARFVRSDRHLAHTAAALFLRPVDAVGVVLVDVGLAADLHLEPVAIDRLVGEGVTGAEPLVRAVHAALHRQAPQLTVLDQFLVAFEATQVKHQRGLCHAGQSPQGPLHRPALWHRAKGLTVKRVARVVPQAQCHRVGHGLLARVGKVLRLDLQHTLLTHRLHPQGVRAIEPGMHRRSPRHIGPQGQARLARIATGLRGGPAMAGGPAAVGQLEFMLALKVDVQVPGVAIPDELKVVLRGPAIHAAAQVQGAAAGRCGVAGAVGALGEVGDRVGWRRRGRGLCQRSPLDQPQTEQRAEDSSETSLEHQGSRANTCTERGGSWRARSAPRLKGSMRVDRSGRSRWPAASPCNGRRASAGP